MKKLYVDKSIIVLCAINFILFLFLYFGELYLLDYGGLGGNENKEATVCRLFVLSNMAVYLFGMVFAFGLNFWQYNVVKKGLTKKERGWRVISNALATAIPFLFSLFLWAAVTFMAD